MAVAIAQVCRDKAASMARDAGGQVEVWGSQYVVLQVLQQSEEGWAVDDGLKVRNVADNDVKFSRGFVFLL